MHREIGSFRAWIILIGIVDEDLAATWSGPRRYVAPTVTHHPALRELYSTPASGLRQQAVLGFTTRAVIAIPVLWRKRHKLSVASNLTVGFVGFVAFVIGSAVGTHIDPPGKSKWPAVSRAVREAQFVAQHLVQTPDPGHDRIISWPKSEPNSRDNYEVIQDHRRVRASVANKAAVQHAIAVRKMAGFIAAHSSRFPVRGSSTNTRLCIPRLQIFPASRRECRTFLP